MRGVALSGRSTGPRDVVSALAERKQSLRRDQTSRRRNVSPDRREAAGRAVASHFMAEQSLRSTQRIALYAALPDELPTRATFDALRTKGRSCLFPRIQAGTLVFAPVLAWDELVPADHGVLSPPPGRPEEDLGAGDVVLVPGVAFDAAGKRLGRGGGYYDRAFMAADSSPVLIGVAYAFQIVLAVPVDSRDRAVDAIVTERGLRWLTGSA